MRRRCPQADQRGADRSLWERLDDLDDLLTPIPVLAGEVNQFLSFVEEGGPFGSSRDRDPSTSSKLKYPFVPEKPECPEHSVGVHAEHGSHVTSRRQALPDSHVTIGDVPPDLSGHLIMERDGFVSGDLDFLHGNKHSITMAQDKVTALKDRPPQTKSPEAVIREARRRQRRRNLAIIGIVLVALVAAVIAWVSVRNQGTPTSHTTTSTSPRVVPTRTASTSTAFVWDATGLIPIDLDTDAVGSPIPISGLSTAWPNVVAVPGGKTAYALSLSTPKSAGVDEAGASLIPVNLVSRTVGSPIPFRATVTKAQSPTAPPSFDIEGLAITPNGRTILVADAADRTVIPIDVVTRRVETPIPLPYERPFNGLIESVADQPPSLPKEPAEIDDLTVNPQGTRAYVVDGDTVIPIDLPTHRALPPITGFDAPSQIAISPNGLVAYVTNPYCWESLTTDKCAAPPTQPVSEPNGRIQLGEVGQHVDVVSLRTDRIEKSIDLGMNTDPTGIAISPDGSTVYVSHAQYSKDAGFLTVLRAHTDSIESEIALPSLGRNEGSDNVAITPDGKQAFVSGFHVITPGPYGPVVLRGVVIVNLSNVSEQRTISFGTPTTYGLSTGPVIFGA